MWHMGPWPSNPMSWKALVEFRGRWQIYRKLADITPPPSLRRIKENWGVRFTRTFLSGTLAAPMQPLASGHGSLVGWPWKHMRGECGVVAVAAFWLLS